MFVVRECNLLHHPLLQTEFFQDDLFPDTAVAWEPAMTADQWLSGCNKAQRTISLRPEGMKLRTYLPSVPVCMDLALHTFFCLMCCSE